jgi:hypothetical protein
MSAEGNAIPVEPMEEEKETAKEVQRPHIGGAVVAILSLINICLCATGTSYNWFTRRRFNGGDEWVKITLWTNSTYINRVFRSQFFMTPSDLPCSFETMHFYAAEGTAIASTALALVGVVGGILMIVHKKHRWLAILVSLFSVGSTMTTWAIGARIYNTTFCGNDGLQTLDFDYAEGLGLFIGASVAATISFFFAVFNPREPSEAFKIKALYLFSAVVSCIACILAIGALPVSWFRYKVAPFQGTLVGRDVTLWNTIYYYPTGATTVAHTQLSCQTMSRYFVTAETFGILTIAGTAFAALFNWLTWANKMNRAVAIAVSAVAAVFALTTWTVGYTIFNQSFCSSVVAYNQGGFTYENGFGLEVSAFALMVVVSLALGVAMIKARREEGKPELNKVASLFAFTMFIACLCTIICAFGPQFSQAGVLGNGVGITYSFWTVKTATNGNTATYTSINDITCNVMARYFNSAGALDIVAIVVSFVTTMFGIVQTYNRRFRKAAVVLAFTSAVFMAASWIIMIVMYNIDPCENNFVGNMFSIEYGLGLEIFAFCITVVIAVVNVIFG